ncbi:MAG: glycoside hydrolase family 28 protein [Verrucomicrobiota bacterium]
MPQPPSFKVAPPRIPDTVFPITDFNAKPAPGRDNSGAIARAIEACHVSGGGRVEVPAGEWLTGPIHLRSKVRLHLEEGAALRFSQTFEDYLPVVFTRWEGVECYNYSPLIYALDCEDIAVTGKGRLLGGGEAWWDWKQSQPEVGKELYEAEYNGIDVNDRIYGRVHTLRPSFVQPVRCKRVLIEGVTIEDGPMWTVHPVYCEDVTVRGIGVASGGPNTDGLNPDSCERVLIERCAFSTGDDCIALNAGMNEDGSRVNRPCRDVLVRHCKTCRGHGGIVIGSAVSGGIENVYVHDLRCEGTDRGIRIKSIRGRGGYVKNVLIERVVLEHITKVGIEISMYYPTKIKPRSSLPSTFEDIAIRNVSGTAMGRAVSIRGLPESPVRNLTLEAVDLSAPNPSECADVENIQVKNCALATLPETEGNNSKDET